MDRLKVYNHEIKDKFEFCQVVSEFNHELSQAIGEKPVARWAKERENLQTVNIQRVLSYSIENDEIIRKVSNV